jgi:hypothetical protein
LADLYVVLIDEKDRRDADLVVVAKVRRNGVNPPKKLSLSGGLAAVPAHAAG